MLNLKITSPEGVIVETLNALYVTVPTTSGVVTIMDDHIPLLSIVSEGEILVKNENGDDTTFEVKRGILEVRRQSVVNILIDDARNMQEIEMDKFEAARAKATKYLESNIAILNKEETLVQGVIEGELSRTHKDKKYKNVGKTSA